MNKEKIEHNSKLDAELEWYWINDTEIELQKIL